MDAAQRSGAESGTSWPGTPAAALDLLIAGNKRFIAGDRLHPNQDADRRAAVAPAQRPFAVLFGCSDSRLAAEIIFDRGLGDLFVVRTAGHVVGPEVLASVEYAVTLLNTPLVVVLGHDSCGAIEAACATANGTLEPGDNLRPIVDGVLPSLAEAEARGATDRESITDIHVERTIDLITQPDSAVADAVKAGRCTVVGFRYRLADGNVTMVHAH